MDKQLYIYVAGPYTAAKQAEIESNVNQAIDAGVAILRKGHYPFIPHLTHFVDVRSRENRSPISYEEYLLWDLGWLAKCDAILFLGRSPGADRELQAARQRAMQIFYSPDEIPSIEAGSTGANDSSAQRWIFRPEQIEQLK